MSITAPSTKWAGIYKMQQLFFKRDIFPYKTFAFYMLDKMNLFYEGEEDTNWTTLDKPLSEKKEEARQGGLRVLGKKRPKMPCKF